MGAPTRDRVRSGRPLGVARRKQAAGASSVATAAYDAFICYSRDDTSSSSASTPCSPMGVRPSTSTGASPTGRRTTRPTSSARSTPPTRSSSSSVRIPSPDTGRPAGEPLATGSSIEDLAFDPGSAILASADSSGAIRLWDIKNGRQVGSPLRAHVDEVTALAFRADGEMLASTDVDEAVVVWDPVLWTREWSRIADRLCTILSRNLTSAEWEQFLPGRPHQATCE
jgi:WD40 repeat protein